MTQTTTSRKNETALGGLQEQYHPRYQPAADSKASRTNRNLTKRRLLQLLQALAAVIICLFLLESFFSFAGVGEQEILMFDPQLGCKHIPNKFVTWRLEGYSKGRFTKDGLRDIDHSVAKPPDTIRIALVGDSLTECLQVPLERTWARQLEAMLNASPARGKKRFEVINFGVSSYSTAQEWIYYKNTIAKYKPDYVVVLYSRGDTLENAINPKDRAKGEPRPYFYLDAKGRLNKDMSVIELNGAKIQGSPVQQFLQAHSRIYGVFSQTNLALLLNEKLYWKIKRTVEQVLAAIPGLQPKDSGVTFPDYPPQDNLKVSCATVDQFAADVHSNGSKFVLILFPDINTMYGNYTEQIVQLKKMAKEKDFDVIDLTDDFKRNSDKSLVILYHMSQDGNDVTAKAVARFFSGLKPKDISIAP